MSTFTPKLCPSRHRHGPSVTLSLADALATPQQRPQRLTVPMLALGLVVVTEAVPAAHSAVREAVQGMSRQQLLRLAQLAAIELDEIVDPAPTTRDVIRVHHADAYAGDPSQEELDRLETWAEGIFDHADRQDEPTAYFVMPTGVDYLALDDVSAAVLS